MRAIRPRSLSLVLTALLLTLVSAATVALAQPGDYAGPALSGGAAESEAAEPDPHAVSAPAIEWLLHYDGEWHEGAAGAPLVEDGIDGLKLRLSTGEGMALAARARTVAGDDATVLDEDGWLAIDGGGSPLAELELALSPEGEGSATLLWRVARAGAWEEWQEAPASLGDPAEALPDGDAQPIQGFEARLDVPSAEPVSEPLATTPLEEPAPKAASAALKSFIALNVGAQAYQDAVGWRAQVRDGSSTGGEGMGHGLRGLRLKLLSDQGTVNGSIHYSLMDTSGRWSGQARNGSDPWTANSRTASGLKVALEGDAAKYYDVYYCVYVDSVGWLAWARNDGATGCGAGLGRHIEAVKVRLVAKGDAAPTGGVAPAWVNPAGLSYAVHNGSWTGNAGSGATRGTANKMILSLRASLTGGSRPSGSIRYRTYAGTSWRSWCQDGASAVASPSSAAAVQAIQVSLTGTMARFYDVYYRVYVRGIGWLGWAANGASAGSTGVSRSADVIQVTLRPKGQGAPGSTAGPYLDQNTRKIGWQNPSNYYQVSCKNVAARPGAYWPFNYVTPSRIAVNASRQDCINAFVQRAREYLGSPYRWDYSCAPGVGVDCAGLVYQCAYATGMDMGEFNPWDHWSTGWSGWHSHDANNMWSYAKIRRLPISQRQKGDLIFYPGHVAIYIGGDQIIHAYTTTVIQSHYTMPGWILGVGRLYN